MQEPPAIWGRAGVLHRLQGCREFPGASATNEPARAGAGGVRQGLMDAVALPHPRVVGLPALASKVPANVSKLGRGGWDTNCPDVLCRTPVTPIAEMSVGCAATGRLEKTFLGNYDSCDYGSKGQAAFRLTNRTLRMRGCGLAAGESPCSSKRMEPSSSISPLRCSAEWC